jgi:hypothetical protein
MLITAAAKLMPGFQRHKRDVIALLIMSVLIQCKWNLASIHICAIPDLKKIMPSFSLYEN